MNSCCYALERDRGHSSHRRFWQRVAARCIAGSDLPVAGMGKESQLNLVQGSEGLVLVSSLFQGDDGDDGMWMQHSAWDRHHGNSLLDFVKSGGPDLTVASTIFEMRMTL